MTICIFFDNRLSCRPYYSPPPVIVVLFVDLVLVRVLVLVLTRVIVLVPVVFYFINHHQYLPIRQALQDELDAYDRRHKELEEKLDEKTALLIRCFNRIVK